MPFVKLDTNILTSSIWAEDPSTIKVWIYLLASADSNGVVRATVPAIALQCGLDLAMVRAAISNSFFMTIYCPNGFNLIVTIG